MTSTLGRSGLLPIHTITHRYLVNGSEVNALCEGNSESSCICRFPASPLQHKMSQRTSHTHVVGRMHRVLISGQPKYVFELQNVVKWN